MPLGSAGLVGLLSAADGEDGSEGSSDVSGVGSLDGAVFGSEDSSVAGSGDALDSSDGDSLGSRSSVLDVSGRGSRTRSRVVPVPPDSDMPETSSNPVIAPAAKANVANAPTRMRFQSFPKPRRGSATGAETAVKAGAAAASASASVTTSLTVSTRVGVPLLTPVHTERTVSRVRCSEAVYNEPATAATTLATAAPITVPATLSREPKKAARHGRQRATDNLGDGQVEIPCGRSWTRQQRLISFRYLQA